VAKVGLATIISIVLNLFLTFWLVNQYMSDVYFQTYVNGAIGQYYPFIVLTLGVGGGSGLGYLFLKKRHSDTDLISKIQKSKSFKPGSPMSGVAASPSRQILPTGAPPSPSSKHTVYAVPPLPKSSTPSSSRVGTATWASAKPPVEAFPAPKQESRPSTPTPQPQRIEPPRPQPTFGSGPETPPLSLNAIGSALSKPGTSWTPQPSQSSERRPDFGPAFQKPGLDTSAKQTGSSSGFPAPSSSQPAPVPSKWASPEDRSGPSQFGEGGGVRSIPPLPTKWTPPSGSPGVQDRSVPPPQGFPRPVPGPGPVPGRSPVPLQQGPPRPFVAPGSGRPGDPRPIAAPRPFRPEPIRPPGALGQQPRPPQPVPRPAAPLAGPMPMPQPWTPPAQAPERKEPSSVNLQSGLSSGDESTSTKSTSDQKAPSESGGGGEMDWDTALDTILKTLRKDRVGDTK
jgi:hypothetical protein